MADNNTETQKKEKKSGIKEFIDSLVVAFVIAILILTFLIGNYMIPSGSMLDTLQLGDRILVNKLSYVFSKPKHGDVVVFDFPLQPGMTFIKRIIGRPGDTIQIKDKQIYRNNELVNEPYVSANRLSFYSTREDNTEEFVIPEGMYLVMGDNRDNSYDGRFWGYIPENIIKGKALIVYFSKEPEGAIRWSRFLTLIK